ncbi:hypothetical protein C874_11875 [Elizabethkingia anophelis 502]|nr:hypothetical protein C874_11875 [Elizabethkingia anophelis 502]
MEVDDKIIKVRLVKAGFYFFKLLNIILKKMIYDKILGLYL